MAACLLSAILLSGCGGDAPSSETTDGGTSAEETTSSGISAEELANMSFIERLVYNRTQIEDDLPEKDFGGEAFRIGFLWFNETHMYSLDWLAEEETGDTINDAVYARNMAVEDRFNVKLEFVKHPSGTYQNAATASILAGEDAYDMMSMHPAMYNAILLQGLLVNFDDLVYVDLEKPWWMQDSIESLSLDNETYVAYGAATSVTLLADSPIMYFNKTLAEDYGMGNLYDVVREGKWTADKVVELIKNTWRDLDGNGEVSEADQFGFVIPDRQIYRLFWSLGGRYVEKTSDGGLTLFTNTEKVYSIFDTSKAFLGLDQVYLNPGYDITVFQNGRSVFANGNMSYTLDVLRDTDFAYGILPNFKLDESQEAYYTNGGGGPQGVPITNSDLEKTAIIMEALNAESYKRVIPAFYDSALKGKYAGDENDMEMLDIIYSNVVYDSCRAYCVDMENLLKNCVNPNWEFASAFASLRGVYEEVLQSNVKTYRELKK